LEQGWRKRLWKLGFDLHNEATCFPGIPLGEVMVNWASRGVTMYRPITSLSLLKKESERLRGETWLGMTFYRRRNELHSGSLPNFF